MAFGTKVTFGEIREVAFGSIGAAYAVLGSATDDYDRIISLHNTTDQDVYISFDGVTNNIRLASGSAQVFDLTTNAASTGTFFLPKRTMFYQKRAGAAPTVGNVWIQEVYAEGGV